MTDKINKAWQDRQDASAALAHIIAADIECGIEVNLSDPARRLLLKFLEANKELNELTNA